jgi:hypothetical protein
VLAQFIRHSEFEAVVVAGEWSRAELDPDFVRRRTDLVSRGYARLLEIAAIEGDRDVTAYPLPEAIEKYIGKDRS